MFNLSSQVISPNLLSINSLIGCFTFNDLKLMVFINLILHAKANEDRLIHIKYQLACYSGLTFRVYLKPIF